MRKVTAIAALALASAITLTGCAAESPAPAGSAGAAFPESGKVITLIVPFDAGGLTDTLARLFAPEFEAAIGTTVRVENRPGAGGQIGLTELAAAEPDGYTIGFTNLPSGLAYLDERREATYTFDSFTPIGSVALSPTVIAVSADSPYKTLKDFVKAAKKDPGNITLGSGGSGASDDYLASIFLEEEADIDLNIVTFEGGSADKVTALLGGNVEAIMGSAGGFLGQVESGAVRLLGSASEEQSAILDDVPTFTEQGYDVISSGSINISGPAGIPENVVNAISAAIKTAVSSTTLTDKLAPAGFEAYFKTPAELTELWLTQEKLVKTSVFPG